METEAKARTADKDKTTSSSNTLNSWTPIHAKMNSSKNVTRKML